MPLGPRVALAVFAAGFALEAFGGFYYLTQPTSAAGAGALLYISPVIGGLGVVLLWLGMRSWTSQRRAGSRAIGRTFAWATIALLLAAIPFVWQLGSPGTPLPDWAVWEFGAAIAVGWTLTFLTYGYVVLRLGPTWARAIVVGAVVWAAGVSAWLAYALAGPLPTWTSAAVDGRFPWASIPSGVVVPLAYLAPSYLLLFVVYLSMIARLSVDRRGSGGRGRPLAG